MQIRVSTETNPRRRLNRKTKTTANKVNINPTNSTSTSAPTSFQEIMDGVLPIEEETNVNLHRLWQELPRLERMFLADYSEKSLSAYRNAVIQIAKLTLQKNVNLKKIRKLNKNKKVELTLLEFLDERLQRMAILMFSPQNSAFSMLKILDEIRGILLDVRQ